MIAQVKEVQRTGDLSVTRLEQKLNSMAAQLHRLEKAVAELGGTAHGVSEELQPQLRRIDALDTRMSELHKLARSDTETRQKLTELDSQVNKLNSSSRILEIASEDLTKKLLSRVQRVEGTIECNSEGLQGMALRMAEMEEFYTQQVAHQTATMAASMSMSISGAQSPAMSPRCIGADVDTAHVVQKLGSFAQKFEQVTQEIHDLHAKYEALEQRFRTTSTRLESFDGTHRQLHEHLERLDGGHRRLGERLDDHSKHHDEYSEQLGVMNSKIEDIYGKHDAHEQSHKEALAQLHALEGHHATHAQEVLAQFHALEGHIATHAQVLSQRQALEGLHATHTQEEVLAQLQVGAPLSDGDVHQCKVRINHVETRLDDFEARFTASEAKIVDAVNDAEAAAKVVVAAHVEGLVQAVGMIPTKLNDIDARLDEMKLIVYGTNEANKT